jgi:M6 family metalloprotease-like protein
MRTKNQFLHNLKRLFVAAGLALGLTGLFWGWSSQPTVDNNALADEPDTITVSGWLLSRNEVYMLLAEQAPSIRLFIADQVGLSPASLEALHGQYVTVSGVWSVSYSQGKGSPVLLISSIQRATARSASPFAPSAIITGSNPWIWILCKFSDDASEPAALSYFQTLISDLNPYFQETSYNKADIAGSNVEDWYTLPQPRSYYVYDMGGGVEDIDFQRAASDCTAVADADVDFTNIYGLNLMFNGELDSAFGVTTAVNMTLDGVSKFWPSVFIDNKGGYNMALTAHEMYHGFGLGHSGVRNPDGTILGGNSWDPVGVGACGFSSCIPSHIPAPQKDELGWIDGDKIVTATLDTQTVTLESLALPQTSNPLMVKIPLEGNHFYTLESRRPAGYDSKVPEAVLIHEVNLRPGEFSNGHIGLIPVPGASSPGSFGAIWSTGSVFTDTTFGITVTVVATTTTGFQVQIDRQPIETTILYVDAAASGANNGSSWANALTDLQTALAAANPTPQNVVEIWVAEGTYKPTAGSDRAATFQLRENIPIFGGFAGTETDRSQRNITLNATVLSGDLQGNDNANIAADEVTRSDNSYHVVTANGVATTLDGVIVSGGNANGTGTDENRGGGILNYLSDTIYRNIVVQHNTAAQWGGGGYNYAGDPQFVNAVFLENDSQFQGGGLLSAFGTANLTNVTFYANKALYYSNSEGGGFFSYQSPTTIANSIFWSNTDRENDGDTGAQLARNAAGSFNVSYSLISGTIVYTGANNINQDPLFVNGPTNLRLQDTSPAIDAGNNSAVPVDVTTDLDGKARFISHPQPDTGSGTPPIVDMGAFEAGQESTVNQTPNLPGNPSPADGAANVIPNNASLTWSGGDQDGDVVTYTIALGTANPPPVVTSGTATNYTPPPISGSLNLLENTHYYWVITATDGLSTTVGPTWSFTTTEATELQYIYLPVVIK